MFVVNILELPKSGQVYGLNDCEVEVTSVILDPETEDALIVLRQLHKNRTEPMMLSDFLALKPELVVH